MALTTDDNQSPQRLQQPERVAGESARPFDSRELEKLPVATDEDPPYRPWWVIDRA
jgi:hypothetical protein